MSLTKLDVSKIEFSRKDKLKGIKLPTKLTCNLAEDVGIHIGDGTMGIYSNPHGIDYYYKVCGHPKDDREWYDDFIVPLKAKLFNLNVEPKDFSDGTYSVQFRSKAVVLFYNTVIGIPLGKKSKTIDIPQLIKDSNIKHQIACLRGTFDTDFSLTFKKKGKNLHKYPVIHAAFASEILVDSIKDILEKMNFKNVSTCKVRRFDKRTMNVYEKYHIFISGKDMLNKWFNEIESHNSKHIIKYRIWKKFEFLPPRLTQIERIKIDSGKINPMNFYGHARI